MIFLASVPAYSNGQIAAASIFGALGVLMIGRGLIELSRMLQRRSEDDHRPPGSSLGE